jgi:hypothetical protein
MTILIVQGKAVALTNLAKCQMMTGEVFPVLGTYVPYVPPTPSGGETSYVYG